jgi:hypothetical protein
MKDLKVSIFKNKVTGELYSAASISIKDMSSCNIHSLNNFLPPRNFVIRKSFNELIIFDSLEENPSIEIEDFCFILISSNNDLIVTQDKDWFFNNFETADPFIELLRYGPEECPSSLVDNIKYAKNNAKLKEKYKVIIDIIDTFNWKEVAEIFSERKYKWGTYGDNSKIPTETEIFLEEVYRLVKTFYEEKEYFAKNNHYESHSTNTGRFTVRAYEIDGNLKMSLEFVPVIGFC